MSTKNVTQAVSRVVEELNDFSPEERRRIVQASLTLLGDAPAPTVDQRGDDFSQVDEFPAKARMWMRQNGLTVEQMSQVFHPIGDGMEIISTIPGNTRREQVRNAYVLSGIAAFLVQGETKFDDKIARQLCERGGFFDHTNHSKYMKGSEFTGSKEKGWVLTAPGLKHGASLIIELAK